MITYLGKQKQHPLHKVLSGFIAFTFIFSLIIPPTNTFAQSPILNLPAPGTMVYLTPGFTPPMVNGITIYPNDPFKFDFLIGRGDHNIEGEEFEQEADKLIKYFLTSLTTPEEDLWVNLSPYEKDRIIPEGLSQTELGRDMLAQDYMLKQITSSLMYPENELGDRFWTKIKNRVQEEYGITDLPMNTFNKVWIVPQDATVYINETTAVVVESYLKVMLEEDYFAADNAHQDFGYVPSGETNDALVKEVIKEVIIPEIEKEVNSGATFANLRQIYNSMILAAWFKNNLKETLLGQVYVDQHKIKGIDTVAAGMKEDIYQQYLDAFEVGVYNYIREEYDPITQKIIPRKYFAGGAVAQSADRVNPVYRGQSAILDRAAARVLSEDAVTTVELRDENGQTIRVEAATFEKDEWGRSRLMQISEPESDVESGLEYLATLERLMPEMNASTLASVLKSLTEEIEASDEQALTPDGENLMGDALAYDRRIRVIAPLVEARLAEIRGPQRDEASTLEERLADWEERISIMDEADLNTRLNQLNQQVRESNNEVYPGGRSLVGEEEIENDRFIRAAALLAQDKLDEIRSEAIIVGLRMKNLDDLEGRVPDMNELSLVRALDPLAGEIRESDDQIYPDGPNLVGKARAYDRRIREVARFIEERLDDMRVVDRNRVTVLFVSIPEEHRAVVFQMNEDELKNERRILNESIEFTERRLAAYDKMLQLVAGDRVQYDEFIQKNTLDRKIRKLVRSKLAEIKAAGRSEASALDERLATLAGWIAKWPKPELERQLGEFKKKGSEKGAEEEKFNEKVIELIQARLGEIESSATGEDLDSDVSRIGPQASYGAAAFDERIATFTDWVARMGKPELERRLSEVEEKIKKDLGDDRFNRQTKLLIETRLAEISIRERNESAILDQIVAVNNQQNPVVGFNLKGQFETPRQVRDWLYEMSEQYAANPIESPKTQIVALFDIAHIAIARETLDGLVVPSRGKLPKGYIKLGVQNFRLEGKGEFSGTISSLETLANLGAEVFLIGHSETGPHLGSPTVLESDELIGQKHERLIEFNKENEGRYGFEEVQAIIAFGPSIEDDKKGPARVKAVLSRQLRGRLGNVSGEDMIRYGTILANEPVYAIGENATRAASEEDAEAMAVHSIDVIRRLKGRAAAESIVVQYGGSVKPGNAGGYSRTPGVGGALVGGASLKAETAYPIFLAFEKTAQERLAAREEVSTLVVIPKRTQAVLDGIVIDMGDLSGGTLAADEGSAGDAYDSTDPKGTAKTAENRLLALEGVDPANIGFALREQMRRVFLSQPQRLKAAGIDSVIVHDEHFDYTNPDGSSMVQGLVDAGIVVIYKSDSGLKKVDGGPSVVLAPGSLENLPAKLDMAYKGGARATKFRITIDINSTDANIDEIVDGLARSAIITQQRGMVPVVEPEFLINGNYSIQRAYEMRTKIHKKLFDKLAELGAYMPGISLKPSFTIDGKSKKRRASSRQVGYLTLKSDLESVPEEVSSIRYLSGGQGQEESESNLNERALASRDRWNEAIDELLAEGRIDAQKVNRLRNKANVGWAYRTTFSYGRGLQAPALKVWNGDPANMEAAQEVFFATVGRVAAAKNAQWNRDRVEAGVLSQEEATAQVAVIDAMLKELIPSSPISHSTMILQEDFPLKDIRENGFFLLEKNVEREGIETIMVTHMARELSVKLGFNIYSAYNLISGRVSLILQDPGSIEEEEDAVSFQLSVISWLRSKKSILESQLEEKKGRVEAGILSKEATAHQVAVNDAFLAVLAPEGDPSNFRDIRDDKLYLQGEMKVEAGSLEHIIADLMAQDLSKGVNAEVSAHHDNNFNYLFLRASTSINLRTLQFRAIDWLEERNDTLERRLKERIARDESGTLTPGGIDFNQEFMNLQIKGDGSSIEIPLPSPAMIESLQIQGLIPVIINVAPINVPLLMGFAEEEENQPIAESRPTNDVFDSVRNRNLDLFFKEIEGEDDLNEEI